MTTGTVVDVRRPDTVREIHRHLGVQAAALGVADVDAASLTLPSPRAFTQQVATWVSRQPVNPTGIRFGSRHSDDLTLWAVFEQAHDDDRTSNTLTDQRVEPLDTRLPEPLTTFQLSWE